MHIQFCGAAKTVTGSCHLLTLQNGKKILLDCGLYQGHEDAMETFNQQWFFKPSEIDILLLSHAHIDHSGRIPKLVKDGFKGKIYCTSATRDLCVIMLLDSAHIQESDAEREKRHRNVNAKPLYTEFDVNKAMKLFRTVEYNTWFTVDQDVRAIFKDAGHILGSASVTVSVNENAKETILGFSGDIGRYDRPILKDPEPMPVCDYLISESTYGGIKHDEGPEDIRKFMQIILDTCVNGKGKLIIPAFSIGRTQEILYRLNILNNEGKLPNIPVYVDSPLAMNATEIFRLHPECMDDDITAFLSKDDNPFGWNNMRYIKSAEQSKQLNYSNEACMIISASGMAEAGRVKHHIFHQIGKPENTILIVGYCAEGTLGEQLVKKPDTVKIFGEELKVRARIEVISSMSAHGDEPEMLRFHSAQDKQKLQKLFLVHGEPKRQEAFKTSLSTNGYKNIEIPALGATYEL